MTPTTEQLYKEYNDANVSITIHGFVVCIIVLIIYYALAAYFLGKIEKKMNKSG